MKSTIHDWRSGERNERGEELFEVLGHLAPDAQPFADGVRERIREDGEDGTTDEQGLEARPSRIVDDPLKEPLLSSRSSIARWAAGIVPPLLLPKGATKVGLGVGGAAATKAGVKLIPGLAMLPIMTLLMLVALAWSAVRSLKQHDVERSAQVGIRDPEVVAAEAQAWWKRYWPAAFLVLALIATLFFYSVHDAAVVVLLSFTAFILGSASYLRTAGDATREGMGQMFGMLILTNLVMGSELISSAAEGPHARLVILVTIGVLAIAGTVALLAGHIRPDGRNRMRLAVILPVLFVLFGLLSLSLTGVRFYYGHAGEVRDWLGSVEADSLGGHGWTEDLPALLRHLDATDDGLPADIEPIREAVRELVVRERQGRGSTFFESQLAQLWRAPLGTDLLEPLVQPVLDVHRSTGVVPWLLYSSPSRRGLNKTNHALLLESIDQGELEDWILEWYETVLEPQKRTFEEQRHGDASQSSGWYPADLFPSAHTWLEVESTDAAVIANAYEAIVSEAVNSGPEPGAHWALQSYVQAAERLERIGREDALGSLRSSVFEALELTYIMGMAGEEAAFDSHFDPERSKGDNQYLGSRIRETGAAIEAIARWGLPPETSIDLQKVDRHLRAESKVNFDKGMELNVAYAIAVRAHLHALPEFAAYRAPDRAAWLALLIAWRLPIAALILAAFTITLVLRAPHRTQHPEFPTPPPTAPIFGIGRKDLPGRGTSWRTFMKRLFLNSRAPEERTDDE